MALARTSHWRARMQLHTSWSVSGWLASTTLATIAFWSIFGACVDASDASRASDASDPSDAPPPDGRVVRAIVSWDPRPCGAPHRVIVELDDPGGGEPMAASVPCALGEVTLDAPHPGVYEGRAYAWSSGAAPPATDATGSSASALVPLIVVLDAPVTRWEVATPR